MDDARVAVKARVTAKRWEKETGGLALPDGTKINTGIDDAETVGDLAALDINTGWPGQEVVQ